MLKKLWSNAFIFAGLIFLIFSLLVLLILGKGAADSLVEQMFHRKQAVTRAGSYSISSILSLVGKSVVNMSTREEVVNPSRQTDAYFEAFMEYWENTPVTSIILIDRDGNVTSAKYSEIEGEVDISVADREYFIWALEAENFEYFISPTILSRLRGENYYVMPVVSPVMDINGNFNGVLLLGISVSRFVEQYLGPLKITENTDVYLIKNDGTLLFAPERELVGWNFAEFVEENPFLGSQKIVEIVKEILAEKKEGKLDIALPETTGGSYPLERKLIAYSPVTFNNGDYWYVATVTSADDALVFATPLYMRQFLGFLLALAGLTIIVARFARREGYEQRIKEEETSKVND